jgi:glucose-1-phosphate thymidylyltransferase
MKGIILAGGTGSRLYPLTKVTNKHLLPVYNKPMIFYPIQTLVDSGINDILIVSGKGHAGHFLELLGDGHDFGASFHYAVQSEAGGIAQALGLAEKFAAGEKVVVMLGDNILEDDITPAVQEFAKQQSGGRIYLKEVHNPRSYGVAEIGEDGRVVGIEEKPDEPKSNFAVVGLYMYDPTVFDVVKSLKPSARGELEITDVNNYFVDRGEMFADYLEGWWGDGGESFVSYMEACLLAAKKHGFLGSSQ